jgi:glycosyltransferase involved in cell wall biosynthesis
MNSLPNIAIIVANYNYGEYVVNCIRSAISQDYQGGFKVFVTNDGSSDDSLKNILSTWSLPKTESGMASYPYYSGLYETYESKDNKIKVINITNSGASTARNVAIWEAWKYADMFAILDADDVYYPHKLSTMVNKILDHDEIGVIYADYDIHRGSYIKREYKKPYNKQVLNQECIVHSGALIRKKYLQATMLPNDEIYDSKLHGPLSKGFIGCTEDYDLWLRLSNYCVMYHIPESLSLVRETGKNQSLKMNQQIFHKNMEIIRNRV